MDDQNKNLILATALSFLVVLVWMVFFPPAPPETTQAPQEVASSEDAGTALPPSQDTGAPVVKFESQRVSFENATINGSIALKGGRIDDLHLKNYKESIDPAAKTVTLLSPEGSEKSYFALFGWLPTTTLSANDLPGETTEWQVESGTTLTPETPITLKWENGNGLTFRRIFEIDDQYMFQVTQSVTNETDGDIRTAPFGVVSQKNDPERRSFWVSHEGVVAENDGTLNLFKYKAIQDLDVIAEEGAPAERLASTESGWIAISDKYWMTSLIPEQGTGFNAVTKYSQSFDRYQVDIRYPVKTIAKGETYSLKTHVFSGAKEVKTLRAYQDSLGIERFDDAVDWGWFWFFTKPIQWLLEKLYGILGNMGLAIIGLTFLIKALLFPLAHKSYVSMARMKELQPEMEKIKERVGDDRQKMQQEMMQLYKTKKVNPASGCLPIFVQMPIFFSLYKVIFVSIELRQAPFFGWIKDLSMPDPSSILNLFGLLPFSPPEPGSFLAILSLGVFPILLGITMWLQQKLNPAPADKTQAQIFAWMPWIFMFMLGSFASGLVIYWVANNTITFIQQYTIMRLQGVKPDILGNILGRNKSNPPKKT